MKRTPFLIPVLLLLTGAASLSAQQAKPATAELLTVDSIFTYQTKSLGPVQWQRDGSGYLALEPSSNKGFLDIVRYDAVSGERSIKVSAEKLTPAGAAAPLLVEEFVLSPDERKLLVFTNSQRVWRSNTRGDYWIVDLEGTGVWQLGGLPAKDKPASLMFAKFSPDGRKVGFVRENNIYVEDLEARGKRITPITADGSRYIVNGTFDWVYEEELFCRDGKKPDWDAVTSNGLTAASVSSGLANATAGDTSTQFRVTAAT